MESAIGVLNAINIAYPLALVAIFMVVPFIQTIASSKSRPTTHAVTEAQHWRLGWTSPLLALTFV